MRRFLTLLALLCATTLVMAPLVQAQDDVDVQSVAAAVAETEPGGLLAALETPIADDLLPEGFSAATYVDPDDVAGASPTIDEEIASGVVGTTSYSITYEGTGTGTPEDASTQPSPAATGPSRLYSSAGLHYVAFDHEFDASALEDFDQAIQATIGQQAAEVEVEEFSIGETPAYRFTIEANINNVPVYMQWVAIPVGNVAVLGMVMLGGEDVDLDALGADAEALSLAGVVHLGDIAMNETEPAG